MEKILVLDFGGQYNQLIARRVREQNVYAEIKPYNKITAEEIAAEGYKGIIFTGGPNSVYDEKSPHCDKKVLELGIPVLGICYGAQLTAWLTGGEICSAGALGEYGKIELSVKDDPLFEGVPEKSICWMSHTDYIKRVPDGFTVTATTQHCPCAAMSDGKSIYAVQFHPEVTHTVYGRRMLHNFLFAICKCSGEWKMSDFAKEAVEKYAKQLKGKKVLCALSGGADSVALLWGLCALREKAGLFVCAAHLNHGLRGALAARDEAFCRALCARAGVPLAVGAADCRALARAAGKGVEEAAREARYAFLFRAAEEAGCGWVLTAHHAGDQAETVLFHLLRGAGAAGLGGMPARRGRLLRPLLECKKADLLAVARGSGWGHVEDETNEDRTYARNRLRALGAELAKFNAGWEQNICRAAALLREDDEALCAWAARERAALAKGEGLDAGGLAALPAAVQGRVVRLLCKERTRKTSGM